MSSSKDSPSLRARQVRTLLDVSGQAPAPSKDFHQVLVTEEAVHWRSWPITLRSGHRPRPSERVVPLQDYPFDGRCQEEISRILGADVEERVKRLAEGHVDGFSKLPRDVLLRILQSLDLESLRTLSCCNRFLSRACMDDGLWKQIYLNHHGWAGDELQDLAKEIGWKTVFFTNRLQLQVMLSRRRRQGSATSRPGSKTAFVTTES